MISQLITNADQECCNHGWTHNDRITTIDYTRLHIPEARERKSTSLSLTIETADEFFDQGTQLIDHVVAGSEDYRDQLQADGLDQRESYAHLGRSIVSYTRLPMQEKVLLTGHVTSESGLT